MESDLSQKVLEALKSHADLDSKPLDTLAVSKKVFGQPGTMKMVNPTLYLLLKEGKVEKITVTGVARPSWKIVM